jgi:hypothetical protein
MSGEIIDFRSLREQRRAKLYRQQAVPRAPAGEAILGEKLARLSTLDEQIDRIAGLLGELETLTRDARDLPSMLRGRARASVELASGVLQAVRGGAEENDTDDPQPEVDREVLERMYRDLDLHA